MMATATMTRMMRMALVTDYAKSDNRLRHQMNYEDHDNGIDDVVCVVYGFGVFWLWCGVVWRVGVFVFVCVMGLFRGVCCMVCCVGVLGVSIVVVVGVVVRIAVWLYCWCVMCLLRCACWLVYRVVVVVCVV